MPPILNNLSAISTVIIVAACKDKRCQVPILESSSG